MNRLTGICFVLVMCLLSVGARAGDTILLEAEGFADHGGWVLDQQFMDQMGSPFLLAHGINAPVADATTSVTFPSTGTYHVWVRTRDWVAIWKEPYLTPSSAKYANGTPGVFQLIVNGATLPTTFGNEGVPWHWQDGGTIDISNTNVSVALHDLTGYEGRCDAVVFSKEYTTSPPPNVDPAMKLWRRDMLGSGTPALAGQYDLVVVGGGIAGTCTAITAARLGVSVALIQDRPVLGGNNSSEVRVHLLGSVNYEPYPLIGNIVTEIDPFYSNEVSDPEYYRDDKKLAAVQAESNIDLYLNYRGNEVEMNGDRIAAVIAESTETGQRLRFESSLFADCTGDGVIGYLAGADWEMIVTGPGGTRLGKNNQWRFVSTGSAKTFPSVPWALNLTTSNFPGGGLVGGWFWESGYSHDPFEKGEYIRDWNFRAAYGAWDALKNKTSGYNNYAPDWQAYISGKRESRRLMGDVILEQDDLLNRTVFDDGCFPLSWPIDLHYPDPTYGVNKGFGGDEFIATFINTPISYPYWAPYRCLYSRNIDNLFMAGRNISVTHQALGSVRVQRTTGMMGEIVGMAASLCKEHNALPRDVYSTYLSSLKDLMQTPITDVFVIMSNGFESGTGFDVNGWAVTGSDPQWTFSSGNYGNPHYYAWGGAYTGERADIESGRLSYVTSYAIQEGDIFSVDFDATAMEANPEPTPPFGSSLLAELSYMDGSSEVILGSLEIMRADMVFNWGAPDYDFEVTATSASVGKNLIVTFSGGPNSWNGESAQRIGIDNVIVTRIDNVVSEPTCGDEDHPYPIGDLDQNCSVDILDIAILASDWLTYLDPLEELTPGSAPVIEAMSNGFESGTGFDVNGWAVTGSDPQWSFSSGNYGNPHYYAWGGAFTGERADIESGRLSYVTSYAIQEGDIFSVDFDATAMEAFPEPATPFGSSLLVELSYMDGASEVVLGSLEIMRADMAFGWGAPDYDFVVAATNASVGKELIVTFSGGPNSWNGESAQRIGIDNVTVNRIDSVICGDENHPYLPSDFDQNCSVDILDIEIIASNWLACTHPDGCL